MKKSKLLIILSLMQFTNAFAQSHGGVQEYYNMGENERFHLIPTAYFQTQKNWYFEGRYNYEELNTVSMYAGKVYEKEALITYSINPMLGVLIGRYMGGSAGLNLEVGYKKLAFSSQSQYTFCLENKNRNFTYSWSELSYEVTRHFGAGFSLQQTGEYATKNSFDKGAFIRLAYDRWTLPFYVFSDNSHKKYFILSLIYEWTHP